MADIDLSTLETLRVVESNDKILGYSVSGNKFGFIPVDVVTQGGYACRRWNINNSSPVGEAYGNIDYLRELPSLLGLGCYLVDKNHGRRKLDPTNHYKFATGETAALDGSMGDYMWGWGTKWYYAFWTEGNYYYEAASLKPIPGRWNYEIPVGSTSALGVSVVDRTNLELVSVINNSAQFRGGNNDATLDEAFNSYLGMAATNLTAAQFGEYARKKGEGWEGYWYAHAAVVGILFRIIFGTRNVEAPHNASKDANGLYQGGFGAGVTGGWPASFKNRPFMKTSEGVSLGDACGLFTVSVKNSSDAVEKTYNAPCFFGLKNFYGYMGRWERGSLINKLADGSGDMYVLPSLHSTYSMNSLNGLVKAATLPATANGEWEYIRELSNNMLCHTPTVCGTTPTASTFYADALYNDNAVSGLRVPSRGGSASYAGSSGLEFLSADSAVSASSAVYGSPLCEAAENWNTTPFLAA